MPKKPMKFLSAVLSKGVVYEAGMMVPDDMDDAMIAEFKKDGVISEELQESKPEPKPEAPKPAAPGPRVVPKSE